MVMDLLRGKDAPGPEEHVTEIEGVRRDVADLETQIAAGEAALAALEEERGSLRYRREVLKEKVDDAGLEDRIAETERRQSKSAQSLRHQRAYLAQLERPLLEAQAREALDEFSASAEGRETIVRAEAEALMAYWEARAVALEWQSSARQRTRDLNRLRARLGEPEVTAPGLPAGPRLKPQSVMSGESARPEVYRAAATRLRTALEATDGEIASAYAVKAKGRTVAQDDFIALHPPRST